MAYSQLDWSQVLKDVHDESTHTLRTSAVFNGSIAEVAIDQTNDSVAIGDGSTLYTGTTVGPDHGLDVNVLNQLDIVPSGLKNGLRAVRMTITDVPSPVPTNIISPQNGMSLRILGTNTVYIGNYQNTSADGYPKFQFEELTLDVTSAVPIYLCCEAGKTCEVAILAIG